MLQNNLSTSLFLSHYKFCHFTVNSHWKTDLKTYKLVGGCLPELLLKRAKHHTVNIQHLCVIVDFLCAQFVHIIFFAVFTSSAR